MALDAPITYFSMTNMQNVRPALLLFFFVALGAPPASDTSSQQVSPDEKPPTTAQVIHVGATREIRTLRKAAQIARDGDTIEVDAGDYSGDTAVWTQKHLTIRGMGQRPRLVADGQAAEGKGIFVIKGGDVTLENLGFFDARVADRNGAGVRLDRGRLTVIRCVFEGNQNGVLTSNDKSIELHVRESTFLNNGAGDGSATICTRNDRNAARKCELLWARAQGAPAEKSSEIHIGLIQPPDR